MKYFNRVTPRDKVVMLNINVNEDMKRFYLYALKCHELEDKIESGELCEREEVRKETAREILLLLGKGFDETARKDFKDLQWYKQFCRELELRYGIDLFGKTELLENLDKLEDEE